MKSTFLLRGLTSLSSFTVQSQKPQSSTSPVVASSNDESVRYVGFERNGVEVFLNIKYAEDTSGPNRFKPPIPFKPVPGTTYDATKPGPACPQQLGQWMPPLTLANITHVSEDCLNLNIVTPKNISPQDKLPVMVWIHGGSFWVGSNTEPTHEPDGFILQSLENNLPVIHVAINYRLGFFGFAQSGALKAEGSENAGLRDQRLAIEWVRDNIAAWGGDGNEITIFGQSSGGLAVGMQLLAYGGTKALPYQRGICESQALEPGITGNFSIDAMVELANYVGCNSTSIHSPETAACLRSLDGQTLLNASLATYIGDIKHNIGDIWLPVVDGDFLPAPPSQLIKEGRFGNAPYIMGWTDGDMNFYTDLSIATPNDTYDFIQGYLPTMPRSSVQKLLNLYPVADFVPPAGTNLTAEFYRTARIFRDILMVCEPLLFAQGIQAKWNGSYPVYLYDFNQTMLDPIIEYVYNVSHIGVIHTSEFAYTYGNISHYNVSGYPFNPSQADFDLMSRASRSWSSFGAIGFPSVQFSEALQGWHSAYEDPDGPWVYVIGGPREGPTTLDGEDGVEEMKVQRLKERCGFINSNEFIKHLQF